MRKIILVCMLCGIVNTVEAQFWGGFLQGALMGTQNALRQQQIRQQQERERRAREEANRIDKELKIESGFKWYKTKQNGKRGAEDYYHNTLIPLSRGYDFICFHKVNGHIGYFGVEKNGKEGACDLTGKEIISTSYESVYYASDGFNYTNSSGSYALGWMLDSEGKGIRGSKESITYNGATYYIVSRDGLYGLTDANGKEIVAMEMEKMEAAGANNRLKFKQNGSWGLMNFLGKILIPTSRGYTSIGKYSKTQKTFAYTMYGYKGECDINGRQISKIKVAEPKQNTSVASSSSSSSTSNSSGKSNSGGTQTIVVEHHRDPVPVQQWQACFACGGMGTMGCDNCGGSGTKYIGDRLHRCSRCNGRGIIPCNVCYGNKGQYITVYQ